MVSVSLRHATAIRLTASNASTTTDVHTWSMVWVGAPVGKSARGSGTAYPCIALRIDAGNDATSFCPGLPG